MDRSASSWIFKVGLGLCLCLVLAGGANAQSLNVTVTGTLGPNLNGGPDPLLLNGAGYTATTTIAATGVTVPAGATSFTYTANLTLVVTTSPIQLTCNNASIQVNSGATSSIIISNCALPLNSTFTANLNFAPNSIASPVLTPLSLPIASGSQGSYTFSGSAVTILGISGTYTGVCSSCGSMSATPSTLSFTAPAGGTPPPAKNVAIKVSSGGVINWGTAVSTTSGGSWLSVSPVNGLSGASFAVTANPAALTAGTYKGTIKVYGASTNSPVSVSVTFTVTPAAFTLNASPSSFAFASINGSSPAAQSLMVTTTPSMSVPFTASASSTGNWLSVSPTSGTTGGAPVSVTANPAGLTAGTYSGMITLTATGASNSPLNVPVTFNVTTVTTSPTSLTFSYTLGGTVPPPQSLSVSSTGPTVMYTATASTNSGGSWLAVTPGTGTSNGTAQSVSVTPGSLTAGTYTGAITVTPAGGAGIIVPVTFTISSLPTLQVSPSSLTFNMQNLGSLPTPQSLNVTVSSGPPLSFTTSVSTTSGGNWLAASPTSGTTPGTVTVSILANSLTAGTYNGSVVVAASGTSNGSVTVGVTLTVTAAPNLLTSVTSLAFAYTIGSTAPPPENFMVTSSGSALSFTAAAATTGGGSWLSVMPTSGSTPLQLTASVNITGLTSGTYNGTITLTSSGAANSPVTIPVTLTVSTSPLLQATPSSYTFNYTVGGTLPGAQSMAVSSSGSALSFTAAGGASWVGVTPSSGTTPATLSVTANPAGLTPGPYSSNVTLTASGAANSPLAVPVSLTVTAAAMLTASPSSLTYSYTEGGTAPSTQNISVSLGTAAVSFTASAATTSGGSWLSVMPTSGTTPGSVTASVNVSGLAVGNYSGSVTLSSPFTLTPVVIPVSLSVFPTPVMTVVPSSLTFSYTSGGIVPPGQAVTVSTNGATATFTAAATTTSGGAWLSVAPTSGTASGTSPAALTVSLNSGVLTGLAAGSYSGTVTITAAGFPTQSVSVSLTVIKPQAAILVTGISSFSLANTANAVTSTLNVALSDGSSKAFTVTAGSTASWLSFTPASGTTPGKVTLTVNPAGLVPGTYASTLVFTVAGTATGTLSVPVTLAITGSNLTVSPTTLTFTYQPGAALPAAQVLMLSPASGSGTVPIAKVYANVQWLSIGQTSAAPGTVAVNLAPGLLQPGTYQGEIFVQGLGSPTASLAVAVTATINPEPAMMVTPSSLTFSYSTTGGSLPAPASLAVSSNGVPLDIMVGLLPGWLTATPARGTTPANITVTPNVAALPDGTYTFNMPVGVYGASGNPVLVPVTLTVTGPATPTATPSTLTFSAPVEGAVSPAVQTIVVGSTGASLSYKAAADAVWLSVQSASGATPGQLTVTANAKGLEEGTYTGSINIAPAGVSPDSASPQVFRVMALLKVGSGVATPKVVQVTNAASYAAGTVAPGMIVAIFGSGLGPQVGAGASAPPAGMPFATTLGETQVTFDGTAAPLLYASDGQVNAVVPFEVGSSGAGTTTMTVSNNGATSKGTTLQVAAASPGIFTANGQGSGEAAVLNEDGSSNSASHPAAAGSTVSLFGTGGGQTTPASTDGELTAAAGMQALAVTATVGGIPAKVEYAGPAPELIAGVMQINVVIPAGTPSGPANVVITVGTAASQTVTVAVK